MFTKWLKLAEMETTNKSFNYFCQQNVRLSNWDEATMQKHVFTPKWKRHDKSQDLEPTDTGTENAEFSAALGIVITGRNDQMANHWHYIHTQGHSFFFFCAALWYMAPQK